MRIQFFVANQPTDVTVEPAEDGSILLPAGDAVRAHMFGIEAPTVRPAHVTVTDDFGRRVLLVPSQSVVMTKNEDGLYDLTRFALNKTRERAYIRSLPADIQANWYHDSCNFSFGVLLKDGQRHVLALKHIPPEATVFDMHAGVGHMACVLAAHLTDSKRYLARVPPTDNFEGCIETNKIANGLEFVVAAADTMPTIADMTSAHSTLTFDTLIACKEGGFESSINTLPDTYKRVLMIMEFTNNDEVRKQLTTKGFHCAEAVNTLEMWTKA